MRQRWRATQQDWALAIAWLQQREPAAVRSLCYHTISRRHQKVLLYPGTLLEGRLISPDAKAQWHDLFVSLILLGFTTHLAPSTTTFTPRLLPSYDMVISDYTGVATAMGQAAAAQHPQRCKLRILDLHGTDPSYNTATGLGDFCCLHLDLQQLWAYMPHFSPGNDFLGYAVPSFRHVQQVNARARLQLNTQQPLLAQAAPARTSPRRAFEVLLEGTHSSFFSGHLDYIHELLKAAPVHATAQDWPPKAGSPLSGVQNRGVLADADLHRLMSNTFAYAGFPAVQMGSAAIEAISQGMVFLNFGLKPAWNLSVL
jgi:hypothetical protein